MGKGFLSSLIIVSVSAITHCMVQEKAYRCRSIGFFSVSTCQEAGPCISLAAYLAVILRLCWWCQGSIRSGPQITGRFLIYYTMSIWNSPQRHRGTKDKKSVSLSWRRLSEDSFRFAFDLHYLWPLHQKCFCLGKKIKTLLFVLLSSHLFVLLHLNNKLDFRK